MRIGVLALVAWRVPPRHYGGWELVAHLLAEGLVRRGHEVHLFATADSQTTARLHAVVPRPLEEDRSLPAREMETLHIVEAYRHAAGLDVVHNNAGVYGALIGSLSPSRVVTTLHGSAAEKGSAEIYLRCRNLPYFSISDTERELLPELRYVATVRNGIDTTAIPPPREPEDYLLYLGRMSPDKGVYRAVEVALRSGRRLLLAGIIPEGDRAYWEGRVAPHVDGRRVEYVGPVDAELRTKLMLGAFAFLHLIDYHEAFGLTMAEAEACGAPVIAFRRGSVPEVVRDGLSGYIVSGVEDALGALERVSRLKRERCSA